MSKSSRITKSLPDIAAEAPKKLLSAKVNATRTKTQSRATKARTAAKPKADPAPTVVERSTPQHSASTRLSEIIAMLRTKRGASIDEIAKAVGWQRHSVHGLISGNIRKKQGLNVVSEMVDGVRVYRIVK